MGQQENVLGLELLPPPCEKESFKDILHIFFKLEIESFGESRKYNINLLGKRQNSFKNLSWSGT